MKRTVESAPDKAEGKGGVRSAEIGLEILKVIAASARGLPLKNIADETGMHPGTVHRYLVSLIRKGMVERGEGGGRYDLGPEAIALGFAALVRLDIGGAATRALSNLQAAIDETVVLFVWNELGPIVVSLRESSRPVTFTGRIGSVLPILNSVSGRIFLAFMPPARAAAILDREFAKSPQVRWEGELVDRPEFERRLDQVRRRQMARGRSEVIGGVDALGAPVFDRDGDVTFVIAAVGPSSAIDVTWKGPVARAVAEQASQLSAYLGCGVGGAAGRVEPHAAAGE